MRIGSKSEARAFVEKSIADLMQHGYNTAQAERITRLNLLGFAAHGGAEAQESVKRMFELG